jgi:uncharacterized protein YndB with AHSA1/START domain
MSDQSYSVTITVDQTPEEAFAAINDVRGWWAERIDGDTAKLGDEFTFHFPDVHRAEFRLTEVVPGKRVVWHVLDSWLAFVEDKTEWNDTDVVFDISEQGGKTEVRFTHVGLDPAIDCFEICSNAWGWYVTDSLRSLITTGKGDPLLADATIDVEALKHGNIAFA